VVFFAAGFETTTAPVAAMLAEMTLPSPASGGGVGGEGKPFDNLSILLSGRLTWPAVAMLLDSASPGFDALVAPGHVSTVMGPEEWNFVVDRHEIPAAVAGFAPESLLASFYSVLRQLKTGERFLDNCYREIAHPGGNPTARRLLDATLDIVDANWRGIGVIPKSGYALKPAFAKHDARRLFPTTPIRRAAAPAKCRPAATARRWCWARSIPTSAASTAVPARPETRSAPAWCRTKAPAASGGRAACAWPSMPERAAVIARRAATRQSRGLCLIRALDCFASLAMTER
jgi:hydrogenase expression/formation protein HypD